MEEFEEVHQEVGSCLEILGFVDIADVASPQALSRHLVLPLPSKDPKAADNGGCSICVGDVQNLFKGRVIMQSFFKIPSPIYV